MRTRWCSRRSNRSLRRLAAATSILLIAFTGCDRAEDERTAETTSPPAATPTPTACSVTDATSQTQRSDTMPESAPLTDLRYDDEDCPRIAFEFVDHQPAYAVGYASPPFSECGSGEEVSTEGWGAGAFLRVRLEPSGTVDTSDPEARQTYTGPRDIDARGRILKHFRVVCDFEAVLEWIVGLDSKHDFRVFTLDDPSRVVIDISETR